MPQRRITVSVTKPGHKIDCHAVEEVTFGGMYEVIGLMNDLERCNCDVVIDLDGTLGHDGPIFEFGSAYPERDVQLPCGRRIVMCATDLTILNYNARDVFAILTQVPHWQSYFPFHTYIKDFASWSEPSFEEWLKRPYRSAYGGGSRSGNRMLKHQIYLENNADIYPVYSSAPELSRLDRAQAKIPHRDLMTIYKMARFGLVIADPFYENIGMVTQRPFEYMCCGMIPIFDQSYNSSAILGNHAISIRGPAELGLVMQQLEQSREAYEIQRAAIGMALRDVTHERRRAAVIKRLLDRWLRNY